MIGSGQLLPATVEAPYIIRVVLGLVIAALQIPGQSVVKKADPIARAHPAYSGEDEHRFRRKMNTLQPLNIG